MDVLITVLSCMPAMAIILLNQFYGCVLHDDDAFLLAQSLNAVQYMLELREKLLLSLSVAY